MEMELQFVYLGDRPPLVPTRLADLELARSRPITLVDTYYDCDLLELRRSGCSLRIRQGDDAIRPSLTLKGPARKRSGAKRRYEAEVGIDRLPDEISDMRTVLDELGLLGELERLTGLQAVELKPIGTLRNRRSRHRYEHGLHRLDLTWDELEYPTGSPETRLEVEAHSKLAERLLRQAAAELALLFEDELASPKRGKTRELCERLYPGLLAA
jgi:inorganic triphosphatase YgiF